MNVARDRYDARRDDQVHALPLRGSAGVRRGERMIVRALTAKLVGAAGVVSRQQVEWLREMVLAERARRLAQVEERLRLAAVCHDADPPGRAPAVVWTRLDHARRPQVDLVAYARDLRADQQAREGGRVDQDHVDERDLLAAFRASDPDDRARLLGHARTCAARAGRPRVSLSEAVWRAEGRAFEGAYALAERACGARETA